MGIVARKQKKSRKLLPITCCTVRMIVIDCRVTGATDCASLRMLFVRLVVYFQFADCGIFARS